MKLKIYTLGCKVNQYESEVMVSLLEKEGVTKASKEEVADIVIVNSCTVTAQSDQKVRQTLRRTKKNNPGAVTVLTGCMVQAFPEESAKLPEADIILGTAGRDRLWGHIKSFMETGTRVIDVEEHKTGEKFESMSVESFSERTRAYIKIEDGCNRFCSYCIIPYSRGRVRSKDINELKAEVETLAKNGYKEIVLTGINLSCFGQDTGLHLCDAIETACAVEGVERVRLGSLEPEQLSEEVIARMAKQKKLCPQFHLSLQSGCDNTLKAMNRHYTADEYRSIVRNIRNSFENPAITTDIMVGFAGETEEDFLDSLAFAQEIAFAKVHVFAYSRRPGTRAYDMPGQVHNRTKEDRSRRMIAATLKTQQEFYESQVGLTETVLFEREVEKNLWEGYTMNYTPVLAVCSENISGEILPVKLTAVSGEHCVGTII